MAKKVFFKKPVLVLVLAAVVVGGVFAQEKKEAAAEPANKFTLTIDAAPLLKALIASDSDKDISHFGVGAVLEFDFKGLNAGVRADLGISDVGFNITYLDVLALWRFYPLAQLTKLYLSTELGFSYEKMDMPGLDPTIGLAFGLRAGWKQQFNKIFIDTSLGYGYSKESAAPFAWHGWQAGLGFGFAL
jgi:hypothetical protein